MSKLYRYFCSLAVMVVFITSCSIHAVQADQGNPKAVSYQDVLGKSLYNKEIVDFLLSNDCTQSGPVQLCASAGMALWVDAEYIETVCLYVHAEDDITPYSGELPLGLKFYDTLGAVEYKLKRQGVGKEGMPDEGSSPDHLHYWAVYRQVSVTIIYNAPYPDEDATIYAILVSK